MTLDSVGFKAYSLKMNRFFIVEYYNESIKVIHSLFHSLKLQINPIRFSSSPFPKKTIKGKAGNLNVILDYNDVGLKERHT